MKKYFIFITITAYAILAIIWLIMGLKVMDGDYDIIVEGYIAGICFVFISLFTIYNSVQKLTKAGYFNKKMRI